MWRCGGCGGLSATWTEAEPVDVKTSTATIPVMVDVVLVGRGRTEITLATTAPLVAQSVVSAAELRLARLLASRIRA